MNFPYTYIWLREDGTPYYVGKGRGYRAFIRHLRGKKYGISAPPEERILIQEFPNENAALEAEKFLISFYGRKDNATGVLQNLTDGGENPPSWKGRTHTPETRKAQSDRLKEQIKNGWGYKWLGRKHTAESRENMRLAHLGHGENRIGKKHTEETKRKCGIANLGNTYSLGRIVSKEQKIKISEGLKKYYANKKRAA